VRLPSAGPVVRALSAHPRESALAVAALVLVPLLAANPSVLGLGTPARGSPVDFPDRELLAGQVNDLTLVFRDSTAEVLLPGGFFPVVGGVVDTDRVVTVEDLTGDSLLLLVPPTPGNYTFHADSRGASGSHTYEVVQGAEPVVSGEDVVANLEDITTAHTLRFSGSPKLLRAAEDFRDRFAALGLDAQMYFYPWEVLRRPVVLSTFINIIVVCGFQQGTDRSSEWIVLGAHMDSVPQAIEGAYDDGSGTSTLLEVAAGLSQFKTHHTIVYCLWGGEEEGLYGSSSWVREEATSPVTLYVNMDMAGLSWPAPYTFTAFVGPDRDEAEAEHPHTVSVLENMTDRELRYPREGNFSLIEDPFGRSDHVSFWQIEAPTVFFFGADDVEYPEYHSQDDTLATMTGHAGGREVLVAGFDTLAWMTVYLTIHADNGETD
jgi:hypothetical protein